MWQVVCSAPLTPPVTVWQIQLVESEEHLLRRKVQELQQKLDEANGIIRLFLSRYHLELQLALTSQKGANGLLALFLSRPFRCKFPQLQSPLPLTL